MIKSQMKNVLGHTFQLNFDIICRHAYAMLYDW